jgi:hypothetical protein
MLQLDDDDDDVVFNGRRAVTEHAPCLSLIRAKAARG